MLSLLGFLMISTFMYLIMSKRMFAMTALILIPILFALIGGFRAEIGEMMLDGVKKIAPTGVMLIFAIMYFGIMTDAGLFDPIVGKILKVVGGDPLKVVIGTASWPWPCRWTATAPPPTSSWWRPCCRSTSASK